MTKHPKRPRDPNQLAKLIVDIATGETEDAAPTPQGQPGGTARAQLLPKARRVEIARKGAAARWSKSAKAVDEAQ